MPFPDVVVVLPGISGSVLTKDGKEVWGTFSGAIWHAVSSGGDSIKALAPHAVTLIRNRDGIFRPAGAFLHREETHVRLARDHERCSVARDRKKPGPHRHANGREALRPHGALVHRRRDTESSATLRLHQQRQTARGVDVSEPSASVRPFRHSS